MLDQINVWLENVLPTVFDDSLSVYEVLSKIINTTNELIDTVNSYTGGVTFTPYVSEDGIISWTNDGGLENPDPVDIVGPVGPTGPAPSITVIDILGGHRITITDEEHPTGLNIDVMNGVKGEQGEEGVSPNITIIDITNGHRITITDKTHPLGQSFDILNGEQGVQGNDGISPTINIMDILGGHRITITDAAHPTGQYFDVLNGTNGDTGPAGPGLPAGGTAGQIPVKQSATDYDISWQNNTDVKPDEIGIVVDGARPAMAVTAGQYVIVRNSTINSITDGLYKTNNSLSPSTDVTAADLTAISAGVLNDLTAYSKGQFYTRINVPDATKEWSNVIRFGRICILTVDIQGGDFTGITTGWNVFLNINQGYRPKNDAFCVGSLKYNGVRTAQPMQLLQNGNVRVSLVGSNTYSDLSGLFVYICE